MQEPKSSCNSSIWKFRHFCGTFQLADPRRGTWSKSLYDRKLSRVVKTYSVPAVRQLTSPLRFYRRFTIRFTYIQGDMCDSNFFYSIKFVGWTLQKTNMEGAIQDEKACIVALARRFTLSQNGYGAYIGFRLVPIGNMIFNIKFVNYIFII